jgi:8-oxo-dGTP diphosphatase
MIWPSAAKAIRYILMVQRISAGSIVVRDGKVLLVRHRKDGEYDFWVAPGGGVNEAEDATVAAVRETNEEAGISVRAGSLVCVEDLWHPGYRECKLWFWCTYLGGELNTSAQAAAQEYICEAKFLKREELRGRTVFPPILTEDAFWEAIADGPPVFCYLGLREMTFW